MEKPGRIYFEISHTTALRRVPLNRMVNWQLYSKNEQMSE